MKKTSKILAVPCVALAMMAAALPVQARPGGPGPGPGGGFGGGPRPFEGPRGGGHGPWDGGRHHGWCANDGWLLGAGLAGGVLLGAVIASEPTVTVVEPARVVYTPAVPVVYSVPAPIVVQQPVVVQTGHYENRGQQVWVEGRWVDSMNAYGSPQRVWQPGHYENQTVQVWVN